MVLGNCLEVMQLILEASVDAVIADLPYGTTYCPWDEIIPFDQLWPLYLRVAKPNAPIILFSSQPFTSRLIMSNPKMFRYCWYWKKEKGTGFLNAKRQPLRTVEEICVFYKKPPLYNPQMMPRKKPYKHTLPNKKSDIHSKIRTIDQANPDREYVTYSEKYPVNLLEFARDKSVLPTQKPLGLIEYLVKTYTNEEDVVLDNVVGSGTTYLACRNLGRFCIGIENDPGTFEKALKRLSL